MSRKTIYSLFACLLCLLPALTQAQSLTRYEYWFDDDFGGRVIESMSGTDEVLKLSISTDQLDYGIHKFSFRTRQSGSDYPYSAVTSSLFLKRPAAKNSMMEYWFDDNIDQKDVIDISSTEEEQEFSLDLRDNNKYPWGFHKLNMRITLEGGGESAVYSLGVLKLSAGKATTLEYWLDDDRDNVRTLSGSLASDGQDYLFVDDLEMGNVSPGLHRLYCRAVSNSGKTASAVTSSLFLKMPEGTATSLEYWLDGDRKTVRTFSGETAYESTDYLFVSDLDLGAVTPGHHRLYCRAVGNDGKNVSAITVTPIMVKSRYSMGGVDASSNVKVTQYSLSVDNETPVTRKLGDPDYDITLERDFDVHDLAAGTHTLKAKFYNSFGVGVGMESQFTMTEPETPVVGLTATEKDGIVLLFYQIPANQHNFRLWRVDANGVKTTIYRDEPFRGWEIDEWKTDVPEQSGSYTYYVESVYYDDEGNNHILTSNEVSVNISQAQADLKNCGYITGRIVPAYGAAEYHDIFFSDGTKIRTYDKFFERRMIPVGTQITISVSGYNYEEFETATVTIKPGENHVVLKDLKQLQTFESKPNLYNNDLEFCSDLDWVGSNYQFAVKNVTRNTWSGYVRLRIISKDKALMEKDKEEEEGGEATDPSEEEFDEITPGLRAEDNYVYVYSQEIKNLTSGESTILSISLDDVFAPDKKDWYYVYFESIGKWNSDPKGSEKLKLIGINRDYSVTENPTLRQVNKKEIKLAMEKVLLQDAEYAANIILACCSKLNCLNGIIGNMGDVGWVELSKMYREKYPIDLNNLNQYIDEAIETQSAADFKEDKMMQAFLFYVFGYNALDFANAFREKVANEIFKYSKGVEDYLGSALQCLKYIRDYRDWERMDDYERYFYCADAIIEAASRYNSTLGSVLNTYCKVTKSFVQKALEIDAAFYENYEVSLLKLNAMSDNESLKNHYNQNVDFKIMVRGDYWLDAFGYGYFDFEKNGTKPIREVKLRVHNSPTHKNEATILFDLVPVSDGVMLKQTSIIDEDNMEDGKPVDRMCLEIVWKNGRVTKVPLRADIDGVELGKNPHDSRVRQYTVYFQSGTTTFDNMADVIELKQ